MPSDEERLYAPTQSDTLERSGSAMPWRLHLYGSPQLVAPGQSIALERKTAGALAWLALRGPVQRGRLAELLWPAANPEGARNNLRQLLFKLRRASGTSVVEGQETLQFPASLPLVPGNGELLEGCSFDDCPALNTWLESARATHRRKVVEQRLEMVDAALQARDAAQAETLARQLLAEDELAEPAHLRLVQALYLAGDRRAALEAAQRCEAVLREHLDAEPSAQMRALVALVQQAPTDSLPAGAGGGGGVPMALLRPPRLVGRSRELAHIAQASRLGQAVLVSGEPGLGKSRLLAEAAAADTTSRPTASTGMLVLGARPGDSGVPYASLARWVRGLHQRLPAALQPLPPPLQRLLPELSPQPDQPAATDKPAAVRSGPLDLAATVVQAFQKASTLGLDGVALDDLHFADEASLELLQTVLDDPDLRQRMWLLARRPAEGGPALQRLADALLDEDRLLQLNLAPLDEAGVQALLTSLNLPGLDAVALTPELWRRTGGNPMFVLETLKVMVIGPHPFTGLQADRGAGSSPTAGAEALPRPRTVTSLIERRLKQLSPPALALARVAALAGPDFGTDLAVHVLQVPLMSLADAWSELEAAQVLRDQAFAHDLIFETTLSTVPAPIARHARRSMAEFLAPRGGEPARIGEHWLAAAEPGLAAPHFVEAGRRAEAAARYAEATSLFERGARCHDEAGQSTQGFETRLALSDLLMEASRLEESQRVLDDAMSGALTLDLRMRAQMQQINLYLRLSRTDEAVKLGQHLVTDDEVLEEVTPQRLAELRWTLAVALIAAGGYHEALAQLELAAPVLADTEQANWRCWFHSQRAVALNHIGELNRALEAQVRSVEAARAVGRRRMLAGCLQNGATFATGSGHLVQALDFVDESQLLMAETGGEDIFSLFLRGQRCRLQAWLGRYETALQQLEPLADDPEPLLPEVRNRSVIALAELWSRLGQPARARQVLARLGDAGGLTPMTRRFVAMTQCEIAWMEGDENAAEAAAQAMAQGAPPGAHADHAALLLWRGRRGLVAAPEAAARRAAWQARGLDGHATVAWVLSARDAAHAGRPKEAAALAAEALTQQRKHLLVGIYRPWLHLEIALAARAADPALAQRALREGADWVHNTARYQLPESLRDGFLRRNRINGQLLALADGQAAP